MRPRSWRAVGGDTEFLIELVGLLLAACPTLLSRMRDALALCDYIKATRAARILKDPLHSFALEHMLRAAEALEAAAYQRKPAAAAEAFRQLEKEIKWLTSSISELERRHERDR